MLSLCNNWEFTPTWFDGFADGEGEGAPVRLPHTVREIPQNYAAPQSYQMVSCLQVETNSVYSSSFSASTNLW